VPAPGDKTNTAGKAAFSTTKEARPGQADTGAAAEPTQYFFEIRYVVDGTSVQGNRDRSFLHRGINHTGELSFFSNTPVFGTRRLEQVYVGRYTDNPRVDPERNSLQRAYVKLTGHTFETTAGDALINYSRLTLNQNIKGLHVRKDLGERFRAYGTVGFFTDRWGALYRDYTVFRDITLDCNAASAPGMPAPGCIEQPPGSGNFVVSPESPGKPYSRLVGGARGEWKIQRNGWLAVNWSHGKDLQQSLPEARVVCEDTLSGFRTVRVISPGCLAGETLVPGGNRPAIERFNNDVLGFDANVELAAGLRLRGEFVYGWTAGGVPPAGANFNNFICASQPPIVGASVLDARCFGGQVSDFAGRFELAQRVRRLNWRVDYARFQPDFYSANARQIRDLQDFNARGDYEISRRVLVGGSWRRSSDNLNGKRNFTNLVQAPEVRASIRDLPVPWLPGRRMNLYAGYRQRTLETTGSPLATEQRDRTTRIPFVGVEVQTGTARFNFDYEHRFDSDDVTPQLGSDTDRFAFGYRGLYAWAGWEWNPFLRFELERLGKNSPNNPALSATDPALVFPADFFDAFDTNRSIQAGFLLEAPRYIRIDAQYREFNSVLLSPVRASVLLDPAQNFFYLNQGFKRPNWRAAVTYKVANDENKTVTVFYERGNNFFDTGDPFAPDLKSFRETIIGGMVILRFGR
jgi:hypothetical protein